MGDFEVKERPNRVAPEDLPAHAEYLQLWRCLRFLHLSEEENDKMRERMDVLWLEMSDADRSRVEELTDEKADKP